MYGTVTYTTTAGNEYSFTYATKENFQAAMKNIQAKRQEGKVTKASFTPTRQQSSFSREELLALRERHQRNSHMHGDQVCYRGDYCRFPRSERIPAQFWKPPWWERMGLE